VISKPTIKLQKPHRDVRKYSALCLHTRRKRPQQHAEQRQIQQNQGREFLFFIDLISKQYRSFLNISPHLFQKGISNPYTNTKIITQSYIKIIAAPLLGFHRRTIPLQARIS
jgi:hypothetical protein